MNKKIPENIVVRVCASFTKSLGREDFTEHSEIDDEMMLFSITEKEYAYKSKILAITDQGVLKGRSCPVHTNQGLIPIMREIRNEYHIGKGNVGFGSAISSQKVNLSSDDFYLVDLEAKVGGFIEFATEYDDDYKDRLISNHIIPLVISDSSLLELDNYVLLKDIRSHIAENTPIEAYIVKAGEGMQKIETSLSTLSEEQVSELLK